MQQKYMVVAKLLNSDSYVVDPHMLSSLANHLGKLRWRQRMCHTSSERQRKNPDVFVLGIYEHAVAEAAKCQFSGEVGQAETGYLAFFGGYTLR